MKKTNINDMSNKAEVINKYLDQRIEEPYRVYQTNAQKEHVTEENGGVMFDVTFEFETRKFLRTIFYDYRLLGYITMAMTEVAA